MYDNPFVAPLDNLLARLCVVDGACRLPDDVVALIFLKVIVNSTAAPLRDGVHALPLVVYLFLRG